MLWDTACTGIFVRNDHARLMQFPYKERRLRVRTLGGEEMEIDGRIFKCRIRDQKGQIYEFSAHGLDEVTGDLGSGPTEAVMRKIFPHMQGAIKYACEQRVDYLIGLGKASWHPQRYLKAKLGGDFWIWTNKFGSCIGGSHPLISAHVRRSTSLYTVL